MKDSLEKIFGKLEENVSRLLYNNEILSKKYADIKISNEEILNENIVLQDKVSTLSDLEKNKNIELKAIDYKKRKDKEMSKTINQIVDDIDFLIEKIK